MLRRAGGFSLIELMIVVAVLALLLVAAVPAFGTWVADTRVRSTAEALQNGLRLAQAEALRRNRRSAFVLTQATPALGATPAKDGPHWYVRMLLLAASDESDDPKKDAAAATRFVEGGGTGVSAQVGIKGPAAVCFGPLGSLVALDEDATGLDTACAASGMVTYEVSAPLAGTRALHVQLHPGGRVRMCDPARKLADGEPDGC